MSLMTPFQTVPEAAGGALIASSSSALRDQVLHSLNGRWRPVQQARGGAEALVKLEKGDCQILFLDRRLPDLDSEELAQIIQQRYPGLRLVLLDPESGSDSALDSAFDSASHFEPAFDSSSRLAAAGENTRFVNVRRDREPLDRAQSDCAQADRERPGHESAGHEFRDHEFGDHEFGDHEFRDREYRNNAGLEQSEVREHKSLPGMIGRSAAMQRVYYLARLVAPRTTTVLVVGPTGSGKELVARALHALSPRAAKPFVAVNCAAIPEALLESELFGHARGAFTGAVQAQVGRIPAAHGGTLFLDEVSELPLGMQAKLLRFLEQKEVQRLGSAEASRVDVRVIAASNVDLAGRAGRGEFREDLFYRLSAFPVELPALSARRGDIIPMAEHFLECMSAAMSIPCPKLSAEAVDVLEAHEWKGNVRELQHVMERASILVESGITVLGEHLYFPFQPLPVASRSLSCAGRAS